jgi:group I intron endonuclease
MKSVIYQIRNIVNDKVYVGSAIDETKRWQQHRRSLNNRTHFNQYLQNSWNKYGAKNFLFETLEELHEDDHDKLKNFLIERETFWIDTKHSDDQKFGYNVCSTGSNALGVKKKREDEEINVSIKNRRKEPHVW